MFKQVKERADAGMRGMNRGLPMGCPRLANIIYDVQRGRYDLVAGKTSAGKTAFVDQCYVLNPFDYYMKVKDEMEIKVDWLYFSLEIAPVSKLTKFAAREIWRAYGEETDVAELWSLGNKTLSKEKRAMLDSLDSYFEKLEDHVHFYDEYTTPNAIHGKIMAFAKENGKFSKKDGLTTYTPNHPNHYVIPIIDTINRLTPGKGETLKMAIDQVSSDAIWFRNTCDYSPTIVQQYNASITNPQRLYQKGGSPSPMADDLEDSKRTSKDCNTYLSVFDPSELGQKLSPGGYNLEKLGNKFRQIDVLKNRDGDRSARLGTKFMGQIGLFEELPPAKKMTSEDYLNAVIL
jgi:hypothetical protein